MADKDYLIKESTLTNIADAIREMGGKSGAQITGPISPLDMPGAISQVHSSEVAFVGNLKYNEGYDSAREEFYQPRYQEGYNSAKEEFYQPRYQEGFTVGLEQGEINGKAEINTLANSTSVTTGAVLEGTTFYKDGQTLTGTMPHNGVINGRITPNSPSYPLNEGYYSKGSMVSVSYQDDKIAYPSPDQQVVKSYTNTFLTQVTIEPISSIAKDYTFNNPKGDGWYLIAVKPYCVGRTDTYSPTPYVIHDWYANGTVLSLVPGTLIYASGAKEEDAFFIEISRPGLSSAFHVIEYLENIQSGLFMLD